MKPLDLWLPPDGAGDPVGCVATSFTFDAAFFDGDCLARFLGLTTAFGESDRASDLSLMIETEERLAEASVSVLVDRSATADARNLRWDLVPVVVPGALLHAKVAVLVWTNAMRFIIGSANLTPAGYRRQVEIVSGYNFSADSADLPRPVAQAFLDEVRDIVNLVPPAMAGPRSRSVRTLDLADRRLVVSAATDKPTPGLRLAIAPVKPGREALDGLDLVWSGSLARRACRALSPFWDTPEDGSACRGVAAIAGRLATRKNSGRRPSVDLLVAVEQGVGGDIVRAPENILHSTPDSVASTALLFEPDDVTRRLHAKWLAYSSDDWIAVMFGSSNLTAMGLGLVPRSHREMNLWIGTARDSALGKQLSKVIEDHGPIDLDGVEFEPATDDDEPTTLPVPEAFVAAIISGLPEALAILLTLDPKGLPTHWSIELPEVPHRGILASDGWNGDLCPTIPLSPVDVIPPYLRVRWTANDGSEHQAAWVTNIDDMNLLPPPAELRDLPVDTLLAVLASTRPMRAELEAAFRALEIDASTEPINELDPLKKFASTTHLVPRVRRQSAALWGLRDRLQRPIGSAESMHWRLFGAMGPVYLAERLVEEASSVTIWLPGEAQFLIAELALTVHRTDWTIVAPVTKAALDASVKECLQTIKGHAERLPSGSEVQRLDRYLDAAFSEALR